MKSSSILGKVACAVAIAIGGISAATAASALPDHVKSVTAIAEVFGDGQKVSALAIEYDSPIDSARLSLSAFAVEGRKVAKVYANASASRADSGVNGAYVIVELESGIDPSSSMMMGAGPMAGVGAQAQGASAPPPGAGGPKLGEVSDKPATRSIPSASVTQVGDIATASGKVYKANQVAMASGKTVELIVRDFKQGVYKNPAYNGESLMYNLYVPKGYDPAKKYPLVLFMHDAGVVSNNPVETLTQGLGAVVWASEAEQAKHPCFVLAPQFNSVIAGDSSETTEQMDIAVDLLKSLLSQYSIDPNRLYNTGQSMGGMTSIAMDIKYPDLFAASFLVACQWDAAKVAPMATKPLWIVVSEGDTKAHPGMDAITETLKNLGATVSEASWSAEASAADLKKATSDMLASGASINYAVFKGGNHRYTWQYAYSIEGIRDWLFAQAKSGGLSGKELFDLGSSYGRSGDVYAEFGYMTKALHAGYSGAYERLAESYQNGRGCAIDYAKAADYGQRAVAQGSARAATNLGILYLNGLGVNQDYARALELFLQATKAGDFKGPRYVGIIYYKGLVDGDPDYAKAAAYFKAAADGGDITANYYLGLMCEKGQSLAQDYAKAGEYYAKAAPSVGHVETVALLALGHLYENGLGLKKDLAKAIEQYKRAAALGDADGQAALDRLGAK
jgi:Predicted peptidase